MRGLAVAGLLAALAGCAGAAKGPGEGASGAPLQPVASFAHQVTGVTVSETGRVFVNFPRWTEDAPVSVAEVAGDGSLRPYPDAAWNSWRNAAMFQTTPNDHFVCVQSVVADGRGSLWVVDPAAPGNEKIVAGGPKLVRVDLAANRVTRVYPLGADAAPQGSYMNDVRLNPDGRHAYLTDSGARGALVVVDLASGEARRVLDGQPSTQLERTVKVMADGKPLRRPDGRAPAFAADGIAISPSGEFLYWQALTGTTLYRIPTAILDDAAASPALVQAHVERVGTNGVADGLLIDRQGRMYVTAPQENAVRLRADAGDATTIVAQDPRLRWPDTLSQGPDGSIYVTASHIQDTVWFNPEAKPATPTQLWRFQPPR